jgi:tetratricopeptide (TPR) repeat protein
MTRRLFSVVLAVVASVVAANAESPANDPLLSRHWFAARTTDFEAYSCGSTQAVARVVGRLEQFREAYSLLAGAQAVASPPIIVMAFPDHQSMEPFLALYQGRPVNMAAFFLHGSDENLIVLPLSGHGSLESIFHEYTHLLLRHNDRIWPLWLEEGMAEVYSTFELAGPHGIKFGQPIARHLNLLAQTEFLPLADLFGTTHDSPNYNERDHQGIFYAESWLLTHYLMLGNAAHKARFGQLTALLRQGQSPEGAFTNAFQTSLSAMEKQLRAYLERGQFSPLVMNVTADLTAPQPMATRGLAPPEVYFRLGDQLLRVGRPEAAQELFERARQIAPESPLPFEGLGLLAAERKQPEAAVGFLGEALQRGSASFLAHYLYADEKYELTGDADGQHSRLPNDVADPLRAELEKSLALMPDFSRAHYLLGFLELVQGREGIAAEHLRRAVQLEPENYAYLFSLAEAQWQGGQMEAARRVLQLLRFPYVESSIRARAEQLLKEMDRRTESPKQEGR